jgi:hypothetical protein
MGVTDRVPRFPAAAALASMPPTTRAVFSRPPLPSPHQEALEFEFFRRVVLPNGTFKTTTSNRLNDLNQALLPFLAGIPERPIRIIDVAISSGVSTLEWYDYLASQQIPCDITGTDLTIHASLVTFASQLALLIDPKRNILHMDILGRGARPSPTGSHALVTGLMRILLRGAMLFERPLPPLQGHVCESAKGRFLRCEPVTLLTRRFVPRDSLHLLEEDLLSADHPEFKGAFHVVRAANVLNRAYFSEAQLLRIIDNLKDRMKENGLLVVCRTDDNGVNHATICQRIAGEFSLLHRLGNGSEIEDLLITATAPPRLGAHTLFPVPHQ